MNKYLCIFFLTVSSLTTKGMYKEHDQNVHEFDRSQEFLESYTRAKGSISHYYGKEIHPDINDIVYLNKYISGSPALQKIIDDPQGSINPLGISAVEAGSYLKALLVDLPNCDSDYQLTLKDQIKSQCNDLEDTKGFCGPGRANRLGQLVVTMLGAYEELLECKEKQIIYNKIYYVVEYLERTYKLERLIDLSALERKELCNEATFLHKKYGTPIDSNIVKKAFENVFDYPMTGNMVSISKTKSSLWNSLSYMEGYYKLQKIISLTKEQKEFLIDRAKNYVVSGHAGPDTGALKLAYQEIHKDTL